MAKFKDYSYDQTVMIPVNYKKQLQPGTFEYTLNKLINEEIDLSPFYENINNDETGAPAYDPAILLKIILFSYSRGIVSSREIERFCRENVVCIALSADTVPHFTTIANFIGREDSAIIDLFKKILAICYTQNLIGKNMFAIDGCKISSNCSKEWSGTKTELVKKAEKLKESIKYLVKKHREHDRNSFTSSQLQKEKESIKKLRKHVALINDWLEDNDPKIGVQGKEIKSNIVDNESAKMSSSHGVIQGYNGIAAVDNKNQVIVYAQAFGDGTESTHLPEILEGIKSNCKTSGISKRVYDEVIITADSGFHSEKNMEYIDQNDITAFIADNQFRKRDIRFKTADIHKKKKVANWKPRKGKTYFTAEDFKHNEITGKLICPAGYLLRVINKTCVRGHYRGKIYRSDAVNCFNCNLRNNCIKNPHTKARQVSKMNYDPPQGKESFTSKMKKRFDTVEGRSIYSKRMGTVEPVFGHLRGVLHLDHFTLRSKKKVNAQWLLYCLVHNIKKINNYGYAV